MEQKIKTLSIPVPTSECEEKRLKCRECPNSLHCDYYWVEKLWREHNNIYKKDSLLGPCNPSFIKHDFRNNHFISVSRNLDFCCFNVPKTKNVVVIGDIFVDESLRGQGIAKKILVYLAETYDRDIFAKCVRGTTAEGFWSHIGTQLNANINNPLCEDFYEHREGKRDLGHYLVDKKTLVKYNDDKLTEYTLW